MDRWALKVWIVGGGLLLALLGCDEEEIRAYQAPKDPVIQQPVAAASDAPTGQAKMRWDVPDGWEHVPEKRPMRVATYRINAGSQPLEVVVSSFPGDAGGLLANVNRWRGQVGLEPADEATVADSLTAIENEGVRGVWMDLIGPEPGDAGPTDNRMVAAILRDPTGTSWFVKAAGPSQVVAEHRDAVVEFARTFRFSGGRQ